MREGVGSGARRTLRGDVNVLTTKTDEIVIWQILVYRTNLIGINI